MNKTISINISGFVFNIEEEAYEKLSQYLKRIKTNFSDEEEREEIMADIEARIAELFREKISDAKEVILMTDVEDIIRIMGQPEDYVADEIEHEETDSRTEEEAYQEIPRDKKLYRDEDNAMLGGVCSGLGHYFNIDATIIRIAFVLLTILGGSGILIYLILLFVVPEAKTTAEKLQMKGKSVTLDSIKQHAKEFGSEIRDKARSGQMKKTMKRTFNRGVRAGNTFVRTFSKLFGIAFTLGGIFALIILITIFFGNSGLLPVVGSGQIENLPTLIEVLYPGDFQHHIIFISIILVSLIPVISIITTGIKLLFNIEKTFKPLVIGFTVIWFLGIGVLVVTGIELGMNFRSEANVEYDIPMSADTTDVLYIDIMKDDVFSEHIEFTHVWNYTELIKTEKEKIYLGYPELIIRQGDDSSRFEVKLYKESKGLSLKNAIEKAENIDYKMDLKDNALMLSPYFTIDRSDKIRGQLPTVEVLVPKGKKVKLGENIDRIMVWFSGEDHHDCERYSYANTLWVAEDDEFKCVDGQPIQREYESDDDEKEDEDHE